MPGIFRAVWSKVKAGPDTRAERKRERDRHKLTRKERRAVGRRLTAGYQPEVKVKQTRRARAEDFFYLARAEAKRQRRRRRRIDEALRGGWGDEAQMQAMRLIAPDRKVTEV